MLAGCIVVVLRANFCKLCLPGYIVEQVASNLVSNKRQGITQLMIGGKLANIGRKIGIMGY